ncbi:hypothetical protein SLS62_002377 [Diatrype stigma]|uniref:Secreted protein n=1 Tax=Diatrype stigma TaxID=117547 RepID=A0AAN9YVD4_9PEZI
MPWPKTLLLFALCAAGLYFFLVNGSNGRYPGAWTAGSGGKNRPESPPPTHEQPADVVEDTTTDETPEIPTDDPPAGGSEETVSEEDNSPSVKNKDDEIKEEYEKEYEELGK